MAANLTLAVDEQTVTVAREVARQQGTSLNALIRAYIERLAGQGNGADLLQQLEELWGNGKPRVSPYKFRRDDAYGDRLGRTRLR